MRFLPAVVLDVLVGVFDHDDGGVHHDADGDGDAAQAHDVGVDTLPLHDDEAISTPTGRVKMATNALRK